MSYRVMTQKKSILPSSSSLKNNFGLSEKQFENYIDKLKNGDESLLTHIVDNHFMSCISYLIYNCKINEEKAYDACLDAMLLFRKRAIENKLSYGNLSYLFTRMAKNILLDGLKNKTRVESVINQFSDYNESYKDNEDLFFDVLNESIKKLDENNFKLLQEIYYSNKDIHKVAEENNISYATLRKRKQRMLVNLKTIFMRILNK